MIFPYAHLLAFALLLALPASFPVSAPQAHGSSPNTPVLLELFTSEGCSSCPPADKLLNQLDRDQPVKGADLIVLSEHVDYWNHLGWKDLYSSPAFSKRQEFYASRVGNDEVYTPELVVDGTRALVGSNWPKAEIAIKQSLREVKIPVRVTAARNGGKARIDVNVQLNTTRKQAVVYLALAHDHARSQVASGENAGRDLSHVAVAYSIQEIATLEPGSNFEKALAVSLPPNSTVGDARAIVFVRTARAAQVIGAAQTRL